MSEEPAQDASGEHHTEELPRQGPGYRYGYGYASQGQPHSSVAPSGPYAPEPYASEPASAWGVAGGAHRPVDQRRVRRHKQLLLALAAGALAGAVVGAGTAWGVTAASGRSGGPGGSSEVTIKNPEAVTPVTAAVAKAMPSSVTVSAAASGADAGTSSSSGGKAGTGSGMVLDKEGHILTNQHVATLEGSTSKARLQVQTSDGRVLDARLVGQDPLYDLAVLKVDATDLTPIEWGDSKDVNVGAVAIAIGAPLGLPNSASDGIISNVQRSIPITSSAVPKSEGEDQDKGFGFDFPDGQGNSSSGRGQISVNVLQTDASINHGNSGGMLVDAQGKVIGVNVAIYSPSQDSGSIGLGFAIPQSVAQRVAGELVRTGKASHGQLGITIRSDGSGNSAFSQGAQVVDVPSGSPAGKAGIRPGDVIVKVGDMPTPNATSVTASVRAAAGGATVPITVQRKGQSATMDVTLGQAQE